MIAILADIHSNFEALKAVFRDMAPTSRAAGIAFGDARLKLRGVNEIWCLGDVVGYGPEPNQCCQLVKEKAKYCLLGNHDAGVLGGVDLNWFNIDAALAIEVNQKLLTKTNKKFLKSLKKNQKIGEILLVHGSPQGSVFEYVFTPGQARTAFLNFKEKICLNGHTHWPMVFKKTQDDLKISHLFSKKKVSLKKDCRYIINPGSVGQPRDGDPRASYLLFDRKNLTIELKRVTYDIEKTQEKMRKLALPQFLIRRLEFGG